jgi:hypothetical protein
LFLFKPALSLFLSLSLSPLDHARRLPMIGLTVLTSRNPSSNCQRWTITSIANAVRPIAIPIGR